MFCRGAIYGAQEKREKILIFAMGGINPARTEIQI
jgi:hypothetical protein